jgi:succinyl-CoA synthetase beta subunit
MRADELIKNALSKGQQALSEYESKLLFGLYGIPVTREALAVNAGEAADLAEEIGFPVAVKACSPALMHKSEGGWVKLNLKSKEEVRQACHRLLGRTDLKLDGVLVQEMIPGQRELVLGLSRDPQFGPCVMLGLGGIMTEIFKDTVFRMAPLDLVEATDMMDELKSKAIFDDFRGQSPADRKVICNSLIALGRIGLELEQVAEIDINPLIISPEGRVTAVDGLVVLTTT